MEPKKESTIVKPVAEVPPPEPEETPEQRAAKEKEAQEAEQRELDNAWRKIPYVDQKELRPGYYAGLEMERLWKPWQTGGHRQDFYKATRPSRPTDLAKHYEFGELLKRHDKLVFELENWRLCEFLKDSMRVQAAKLFEVQKQRAKFQKLRKQIRREQLYYEKSLRWALSPDTSSEEESSETELTQPPLTGDKPLEGAVSEPELPGADGSGSEAGSEASNPAPKKKKGPPRIQYSLFHYDLPGRITPPAPSTRSSSPEELKECSFPVMIRSPAYVVGKAHKKDELALEVIALDAWEEKLGGAGSKPPPGDKKQKTSVKK